MKRVFISIGSNLGDRLENCRESVRRLAGNEKIRVVKKSSLYETEPWGVVDQPRFINAVVEVETALGPSELLAFLKAVEYAMGRSAEERWGPRVIDLDILFYGHDVIRGEGLDIPHPLIPERAFILKPLSEVAPGFLHPVIKKSVMEIFHALGGKGDEGIRKVEEALW